MTRRTLRVVHCPVNTAGVPWTNVQALRRRGIDAQLVVFNRYTLHPEADRSLELHGGLLRRQVAQWKVLGELLPSTDLFHFTFGLTLVPQSLQFPILRAFRKRSVMHYLGSDIRGKTPEELAYGKKAGAEIVGSFDAIRWVPEATVIPPGIDLNAVAPAPPSTDGAPWSSTPRPRAAGRGPTMCCERAKSSTSSFASSRASITTRRWSDTATPTSSSTS